MIRTFFERRRVKRVLDKAVDPKTVETLLRDAGDMQPIKQGRIEFVLAFVRGENPSQISERMATVAGLAIEHGALVDDMVGGLVIVAYGTHPHLPSKPDGRASLVQALREQMNGNVKIVHGAADGHYGVFGTDTRFSYTFLVPNFDQMLGALSRLEFGEIEEFT